MSLRSVSLTLTGLLGLTATAWAAPPVPAAAPPPHAMPVARGDGWATADADALGWDLVRLDELEQAVAANEFPGVTSIVVAHDGKLVFERYFGDGGPDRLNDTRSATKSVTALLVGAAIDRGLIDSVQAKVHGFFGDLRPFANDGQRKQAITLEDLLTMSSAWECDDENSFSAGNEERMYVSEHWTRFALDLPLRGYAPWVTRPEDSPYGRTFSYCTAGSFMLGAVVERATRQRLSEFSKQVLEGPLGITDATWNHASEGVGMGGGGTRYRSRDLAKIGQLVADGGRWEGRTVISEAWIRQMLTVRAQPRDDAEYGYQIWRFRFGEGAQRTAAWAMSGNGGNYVFIVPEKRLVAVITRVSFNQRNTHQQSQKMFGDYLLKALPPGAR